MKLREIRRKCFFFLGGQADIIFLFAGGNGAFEMPYSGFIGCSSLKGSGLSFYGHSFLFAPLLS